MATRGVGGWETARDEREIEGLLGNEEGLQSHPRKIPHRQLGKLRVRNFNLGWLI